MRESEPTPTEQASTRTYGFMVMASSSVVLSVMSILVRVAKEFPGVTTYHASFARFVIGVTLVILYGVISRRKLRVVNVRWFIARGLLGGFSVAAYFYGISTIGLAKGTILNHTYPLWAGMFAPLLIRERVRANVWVAGAVAFAGLYLLIVPDSGFNGVTLNDLVALSGGMTAGFAVLTIKKLRETDSSFVIYFSQSIFGLAMVAYPAMSQPLPIQPRVIVILVSIGVVATIGQLLMTYAFKHVGGAEGALIGFLVPVGNVLCGALFFHETMDARMIVGGTIVLAACAYTAVPARRVIPA